MGPVFPRPDNDWLWNGREGLLSPHNACLGWSTGIRYLGSPGTGYGDHTASSPMNGVVQNLKWSTAVGNNLKNYVRLVLRLGPPHIVTNLCLMPK